MNLKIKIIHRVFLAAASVFFAITAIAVNSLSADFSALFSNLSTPAPIITQLALKSYPLFYILSASTGTLSLISIWTNHHFITSSAKRLALPFLIIAIMSTPLLFFVIYFPIFKMHQ